jgi:hypothetical protein
MDTTSVFIIFFLAVWFALVWNELQFKKIRHVVRNGNEEIFIGSSWLMQVLTLGFGSRVIKISSRLKIVAIDYRIFWIWKIHKLIKFDEVDYIQYSYNSSFLSGEDGYKHDYFDVVLKLKNDERIKITCFSGVGDFVGFLPDVLFSSDSVGSNLTGDQEVRSKAFVDTLCKLLNVRVERS